MSRISSLGPTAGGLIALAIWSMTVALARSMSESLGAITAGSLTFLIGGSLSLAVALARGQSLRSMLQLDRRYLWGCGAMFVAYMLCLYPALALTIRRPRTVALVVGLLNYLWPTLMVAMSVPILGVRARKAPLAIGCLLSLAGTGLATFTGLPVPPASAASVSPGAASAPAALLDMASVVAFVLAAGAGLLWALYSDFARRWNSSDQGAVPLFMLASSAALGLLRAFLPEETRWEGRAVAEMIALGVGSMAIAYMLWEAGVRRGNHRLLGLTSYFLPIASLAVGALYLRVWPGAGLLAGGALVVAGALVCKYAINESGNR